MMGFNCVLKPGTHPTVDAALPRIEQAIRSKIRSFTAQEVFNEVRPEMPLTEFAWMTDKILLDCIEGLIARDSQSGLSCEQELAMQAKVKQTMRKHGVKTANPALEVLQKRRMD